MHALITVALAWLGVVAVLAGLLARLGRVLARRRETQTLHKPTVRKD